MPKKSINISVLMPAYNCGKYIRSSIKSILNQTFKDFEFIIIDDGSTDNTEEIINSIKDSRIIYKKGGHGGTSAALNYGISLAAGNWIARIDADDLNLPSRLEQQVEFINKYPDYEIVSSWSIYFKNPNKILFFLKEPVEHNEIYEYLNLHNPINSSSLMFRKSIIKKEKYNEELNAFEDFELFFRIRDQVKFYNLPEFLTFTRIRHDSKTYTGDSSGIFNIINDHALKNLINSTRKRDQFYWATNIAWQNFFYGNRKVSRSYFRKVPLTKNYAALAATYLPEKLFRKLVDSRLKYRLSDLFTNKKKYKAELEKLLS
jgi:glycosyltransferase involved in cell wall biosynthesis